MSYSINVKDRAIGLRKKGYSLNEISKKLTISKSTASLWLNSILLDNKAKKRLKDRQIIGQYKTLLIKKKKRDELFINLGVEAIKKVKEINFSIETYQLLASILYWCEGSKGNLTKVGFTNSDPAMVRLFLKCLRKGFDLSEEKFRVVIHLHSYHNEKTQLEFWSKVTNIPINQFSKSYQKHNSGKRIRNNYQGCVSIRYYNAKLAKELWSFYQGLQKYLGV